MFWSWPEAVVAVETTAVAGVQADCYMGHIQYLQAPPTQSQLVAADQGVPRPGQGLTDQILFLQLQPPLAAAVAAALAQG
jgi:hypothetical protein